VFSRVLVANRGEIAVRVIRALHELGVEAVAVYSTAEREALHVRMADQAVCIGPPSATDSYLRIPNVVAAAETTGCEAVHPGFGFLSENPAFVRACTESDLVFIGPPAEVMEKTGDKARAKAEMRAAGVPLVPGTEGVASLAEIKIAAVELGFPVLLKATSGGGGKGMRVVTSPADLEAAYGAASAEAEASFGDGSLYLERALVPARHVEIQVLCDTQGGVLTLGERECSIQRRHQKLVEESPSMALTPETREAMEASVERACRQLGYVNAGTFEFLLGPDGAPSFIEVNCRLQVEHPVTEMTTGIDIVREQLRIAAGEPLTVTGRAHRLLRGDLVAHHRHHVRGRPDEDELVVDTCLDERGVLGEEAVARVDRLTASRVRGRDHARDAQVALGRRRRPDVHRMVGHLHMESVLVGGRVDRDGLDAELVQRADHPDGDLPPVRNENSAEHQTASRGRPLIGSSSNRSWPYSTGSPLPT
jgi:acetyl-CoA carboxylase biotin carboxylase subunit